MCKGKENCKCGCDEKKTVVLSDAANFNRQTRTVISARDGVMEYLGIEIGQSPPWKIFTVYRSPETVIQTAKLLDGLPVTDDHVDDDNPVREEDQISEILTTEVIPMVDKSLDSTIAVRHTIADSNSVVSLIERGNKNLSLSAKAFLIPHEKYDFEAIAVNPHHLAMLRHARCGDACTLVDRKPENLPMEKLKALLITLKDQAGEVTMQQIVEMVAALPDAIKNVPVDSLQALVEPIREVIEISKSAGVEIVEETVEQAAAEQIQLQRQQVTLMIQNKI